MSSRSLTRWLPPLALLVAVTLVCVLVLPGRDHGAQDPAAAQKTVKPAGPRLYRVRSGDTLSTVSIRTDVPLATLRRLNRTQDLALRAGQRIKLRPIRR